ncbi:MAG: hypothetical protein ACTTIR_07885 [Eggerthia catenaformis]|uniref:hypothetical protein n=1 Tax=Eggerthia catenaformis TaxID=31973 RepID=UPI003FA18B78
MGHTPFGYTIIDGKAEIDADAAAKIKAMFDNYLSGMALVASAKEAGIIIKHSGVKRILTNKHYLGDGFYPALIDEETFNKADEEIKRRASELGRDKYEFKQTKKKPPTFFRTGDIKEYYDNPIKQAQYLYSLIESETN